MNSVRFCASIPDPSLSFPRGVRSLPFCTQSFQPGPEPTQARPAFHCGATPDPQPRHPTTASFPRLLTLSSTSASYFGRQNFGPFSRLAPGSTANSGARAPARPAPRGPQPAARPGPLSRARRGSWRATRRSLHLLPLPSSPRRPEWPYGSRAARSLPNLRVSKPRGRPGQLPAAAPPLPDPPPSGVSANWVPPRRSGNQSAGSGARPERFARAPQPCPRWPRDGNAPGRSESPPPPSLLAEPHRKAGARASFS